MKCVCGYEGEDFIKTILRTLLFFTDKETGDEKELNGVRESYICPKCGTLKIEVKG